MRIRILYAKPISRLTKRLRQEPLPTPCDKVLVWHIAPDSVSDRGRCAEFLSWLSPHERAVHDRFRFDTHRHTYLISHALMRGALSLWADRAPAQWEFALNEYGKPHLANPPPNVDLRFNLSHTNGLAVLALTCNRELGVDVEYLGRQETNADIAERFFAPEEVLDFIAQPEQQKSARFLEYWTLKESYIKAIGMGLSCPLESFAFRPATATQPPALIRVDDPALRKQNWDVWQERVGADHLIALCVQSEAEGRREPVLKHADWLLR